MPLLLSTRKSGVRAVTISHTATVNSGSDLTAYTFSSTAIGAEGDRKTIVTIVSNAVLVSSVTVGGASGSEVVKIEGVNRRAFIWQVDTSGVSGTTADIVVTFDGTAQDCGCDVYAVYGANSTAHDTDTSSANPMSVTLSIPAGGVAIATATNFASAPTFTWSGLTEDSDQVIPASGNLAYTSASAAFAAATSQAITCTPSSASTERMAVCSFGPG